ncbi:enoyl-CoA hydratase/isomerase family protein, partial [Escherichia coli]|uniref:enoyl-CoA hydratase/isomerase family protein n=1 Tax=Escherichia coli TaxID=562 RepID=UPI003D35A816
MTDVVIQKEGPVGRIRLNRPKALHALTTDMCAAMLTALDAWRADPAVEAVVIDHAEGRGFCAGGDIRMLAESGAKDGT